MKNATSIITLNVPSDLLSGADGDLMSERQVSLAPDSIASLAPQPVENVAPIGRPNRNFMLQETLQLAPTALQQAISSTKNVIPPPSKKAPIPSDSERKSNNDEAFTTEEGGDDSDGKILGMPKAVAIGLGIAVVAIGGFLIYKKVKGKK